jgi:hypothetical protein
MEPEGSLPCSEDLVTGLHAESSEYSPQIPIIKVKVKLSLCFNWAPRHEGVLGKWRYSSTHSLISALDGGSGRLHAPAALPPRKEPLVPNG